MSAPRFLAACRGEPVDRPPVWMMRQAGRYLPEYWEVRNKAGSFLTLCRTPDMAVEVTLQPIRRFGFDASILFSDILIPAEAMGAEVEFITGKGPVINNPVRDAAGIDALRIPEPQEACPYVFEIVKLLRQELGETPLIGFTAAPFTLMAYMVQGGSSRHFEELRKLTLSEPALARKLVDKIITYTVKHAVAQVQAGAQAFQLFDTWAELLDSQQYRTWCLEPANEILRQVRAAVPAEVPLMYFSKGGAGQLAMLKEIEADVISIDWRLDLTRAREALPGKTLQGNLDPLLLFDRESTVRRTREILDAGGGRAHIMNLGHGILPQTPIPNVEAFVETVRSWTPPPS